jgi:hypothetical protein
VTRSKLHDMLKVLESAAVTYAYPGVSRSDHGRMML